MQWMTVTSSVSRRAPSIPQHVLHSYFWPLDFMMVSSAQSADFRLRMHKEDNPKVTGVHFPATLTWFSQYTYTVSYWYTYTVVRGVAVVSCKQPGSHRWELTSCPRRTVSYGSGLLFPVEHTIHPWWVGWVQLSHRKCIFVWIRALTQWVSEAEMHHRLHWSLHCEAMQLGTQVPNLIRLLLKTGTCCPVLIRTDC